MQGIILPLVFVAPLIIPLTAQAPDCKQWNTEIFFWSATAREGASGSIYAELLEKNLRGAATTSIVWPRCFGAAQQRGPGRLGQPFVGKLCLSPHPRHRDFFNSL